MCAFICIMAVIGKASRCKCSGSTDDSVIDRFPAASQQHTFQALLFAFPQRKEVTVRFIDRGMEMTNRFLMALKHTHFPHDSVALPS